MPEPSARTRDVVALIAGRYELVRERTGFGEVQEWEGFDSALERRVLVRFLRQDLAQDSAALERFWASARARARGGAASGKRVLDAGTDAETGCAFLICEWPQDAARDAPTHVLGVVGSSVAPKVSRRTWVGLSVVLVLSLGFMAVRPAVAGWLEWVNSPVLSVAQSFALPTAAPAPTQAPAPAATAASARQNTLAPAATSVKAPATATPAPTGGVQRRVVNTDGQGVALRDAPGGKRLPGKGYDEGATVTAFETSGQWTHIKGSDGREGWVLSVTLAP
jgi:hypothetical protein